jgi:hypothetical protein
VFQLVFQFAPWDDTQLDDLIALEERLVATIGDSGDIDGHDSGSNEANIFIRTEDPAAVLGRCLTTIQESHLAERFSAASRHLQGTEYVRHWPPDDPSPFRVV